MELLHGRLLFLIIVTHNDRFVSMGMKHFRSMRGDRHDRVLFLPLPFIRVCTTWRTSSLLNASLGLYFNDRMGTSSAASRRPHTAGTLDHIAGTLLERSSKNISTAHIPARTRSVSLPRSLSLSPDGNAWHRAAMLRYVRYVHSERERAQWTRSVLSSI